MAVHLKSLIPIAFLLAISTAALAAPYQFQRQYLGEVVLDQFGYAASPAGDVNGDGFDDFVVGANVNDDGALSGGKVYLYLGGPEYPTAYALAFIGEIEKGYVGGALASGDLNGDGLCDIAVGAPGMGADGLAPGRVYVFLGAETPDLTPDLILNGVAASGQFGDALCILPDMDGDGFGDLAVGAPRDGDGKVYIYRGSADPLDDDVDRIFEARPDDRRFGKALAAVPDYTGDGRWELLVGVPKSSEAATWAGTALIFHGSADLDAAADFTFLGEAAGDEFGSALAAGDDLDGDGEADFVIGAPQANVGGLTDAGKAYFFRGGSALDAAYDLLFSGEVTEDRFGASAAMGFDWDGDDAADLALGLPNDDGGGNDAGAVRIYFGGGGFDASADETVLGPEASSHLGKSLAPGGDLRKNGRGTVLAGGYNEINTGRVRLFGSDDEPVAVDEGEVPAGLRLARPWPNPANPSVHLSYSLDVPQRVRMCLFDASGRKIITLDEGWRAAGMHHLDWKGLDAGGHALPSGVYFVGLEGTHATRLEKLVLIR